MASAAPKAKPAGELPKTLSGFIVLRGGAPVPEDTCHLLQFDGGAEPNPGIASGGAVLFSPRAPARKLLAEVGQFLPHATNNQAEYTGIYIGLKYAQETGVKRILVEGDSKLVINQLEGSYRVKAPGLKELHDITKALLDSFEFIAVRHILRAKNDHADRLTNEVRSEGASFKREF